MKYPRIPTHPATYLTTITTFTMDLTVEEVFTKLGITEKPMDLSLQELVNICDYVEGNPFTNRMMISSDEIIHGYLWTLKYDDIEMPSVVCLTRSYALREFPITKTPQSLLSHFQEKFSYIPWAVDDNGSDDNDDHKVPLSHSFGKVADRIGVDVNIGKLALAKFYSLVVYMTMLPASDTTGFSTSDILHGFVTYTALGFLLVYYITRDFDDGGGMLESLDPDMLKHLQASEAFDRACVIAKTFKGRQ